MGLTLGKDDFLLYLEQTQPALASGTKIPGLNETRAWVRNLSEESAEIDKDAGPGNVTVADRLSGLLAVALGQCANQLAPNAHDDPNQRKDLLAIVKEISQLRRGDHAEQRLRIVREKWDTQQAAEIEEKRQAAEIELRGKEARERFAARHPEFFDDTYIFGGGAIPLELRAIAREIAKKAAIDSSNGSSVTRSVQAKSG